MASSSNIALARTSASASLVSYGKQSDGSPPFDSWSLVTDPFGSRDLDFVLPHRSLATDFPCLGAQSYLYPHQGGNDPLVQSGHRLGQGISLLDTKQWSPLTSPAASYATSGTHVTSPFVMNSRASPHGSLAPDRIPTHMKAPQVIQAIPDLSLGRPTSTSLHHASLGTDANFLRFSPGYPTLFGHQLDSSTFPTTNVVPLSSSGSIGDVTNAVHDERQALVVVCQPPERTRSGRRHCQRACAINIEGLWIDKDDLYAGAGEGGGMISVHECQWAKSSDPCGMWIIGSRPRVGAHIRKWHGQKHTDRTAKCLWDGCTTTKAMLTKSMNRHVVTVHLGEGFRCHGCDQAFSRKDVYDKHLQNGEVCRDADVAIAYGTECKMIDTRQALQRAGDAVCYAGH